LKEVVLGKISILKEFWDFIRVRKKWWLAPIILILVLLGALIVLTEGSALAPFIYTLF
jgi:hypothetical protein